MDRLAVASKALVNKPPYSTGVNYDHVFSPTLFTEARFGVAHLRNDAQPSNYGSNDATALGIPGVNINEFSSGQVGISLGGAFSGTMIGYSASVPWIRGESNIDFVNNWTKIVRNHTIKFGGDLRRVRDDLLQDQTFSPRGVFNFSDAQTNDVAKRGNQSGEQHRKLPARPAEPGGPRRQYVLSRRIASGGSSPSPATSGR